MNDVIQLHRDDNVVVALKGIPKGNSIMVNDTLVILLTDINFGHKIAIKPIPNGSKVLKYGLSIGSATQDIGVGEHVHIHNLTTDYVAK